MNEEMFNLKEAGKKKPPLIMARRPKTFRLEDSITLAATDRYNDAYTVNLAARPVRDRFIISCQISTEASTTAFVNNWIYKDMAACWEKYHVIKDIITDARDFIEAEGLKNVIFQYMIKHSLSAIASDVENIYETSNPTARYVVDQSTRGNILKNIPFLPFRLQAGPDTQPDVFSAVGSAENPIPKDGIMGESQLAVYQHVRKEKGMRDIVPTPISPFQEAAGIKPNMFKGAASNKEIKTGAVEPENKTDKFIQDVKDNCATAVEYGKTMAKKHYMEMTGSDEAEAEAFYHGVKALCSQSKVVLNISPSNLIVFLMNDEYQPMFESPELLARFNHYAAKREQAERALGVFGMNPTYASVTLLPEGDWGYGKCAMRLDDVGDEAVLLCGDSFRVRNPSRPDYVEDAKRIIYPFSALADCKAASIIMAMGRAELAGGPAVALTNTMNPKKEFGRCEVLIFKKVSAKNVMEIVAATQESAKVIRKILMRMGKIMPVVTSSNEPDIISPAADKEEDDHPSIKRSQQKHFCIGDRVATKPMPSHPRAFGTIADVADGQITVQWDSGERGIFDMIEALMRLMAAPGETKDGSGMVVYSLPGMDDETVLILSASGVDPVSLYSLASHHKPAADNMHGSLQNIIASMGAMGIQATVIKGFVPKSEDSTSEAFVPREWVEAKLPNGARLVIDVSPSTMIIRAGDPEQYIPARNQPYVEIE